MTFGKIHLTTTVLVISAVAMVTVGTPAVGAGQPHPTFPPRQISPVNELLQGVSMVSSDDGWAVGDSIEGQTSAALIEHWDGTSWKPIAGPAFSGYLTGVSADTSSDAWAAGSSTDGLRPLLVHWDGSRWKQVHSPNPGGSNGSFLESVSALSPTNAWAVGQYDEAAPKTFIAHWNGKTWKQSTSVDPGFDNGLTTVKAISPNDVWAAGEAQVSEQFETLVEHWDGTSWQLVTSPDTEDASFLTSLSANSSTDVWLVGYSYIISGRKAVTVTLTEHWNGTQWKVVPSPTNGHRRGTLLASVTTTSSSDAWAAGVNLDSNRAFMLHWDGKTWSMVKIPNPGGAFGGELLAVDAVSSDDVWSVGGYGKSAQQFVSLHEHWNGQRWRFS